MAPMFEQVRADAAFEVQRSELATMASNSLALITLQGTMVAPQEHGNSTQIGVSTTTSRYHTTSRKT